MSEGVRVPFAQALDVARLVVAALQPAVQRCKVAGSLRRRRELVSDIEIVAEPLTVQDLAGEPYPDVDRVRQVMRKLGSVQKDGDRYQQYQLHAGRGLKVDLFLVHPPAEWGSILAIRTGPANLSQFAVMRMQRYGRHHVNGRIVITRSSMEPLDEGDAGLEVWPTPTEEEFFRAAMLPCLPPAQRDSPEAFRPLDFPNPQPGGEG